ncbi:hypothetical protein CDAR_511991 [Caerostris darwini]|uniref:Uncharacterized protein n=1 Tax=Caerostris darwini TaxID=1538125 RepID=A0AAV4WFV2_9ARAC|nr:hypothetical protein CDAR_511991 [Caerostris darwini]
MYSRSSSQDKFFTIYGNDIQDIFYGLSFITRRSRRSEVVSRRTQYHERSSNASATSVVDWGALTVLEVRPRMIRTHALGG